MDINGLHEIVKKLREDFLTFKNNEFRCVEKKVDKIAVKVALIVGAISALTVVANILARVYG